MLFEPADRKAIGEGAVRETGALKLWSRGQGQRVREVSCKYVLVWQKLGEGWKLESCIWNRVADSTGAGQPRRAGQGGGQGRLQGGIGGGGGQGRFQPGVGGGQGRFQGGVGGGQGGVGGGQGGVERVPGGRV